MCFNLFMHVRRLRGPAYLFFSIFLIVLAAAFNYPASAASSDAQLSESVANTGGMVDSNALSRELEAQAEENFGSYGIYVKVLETGEEVGYQEDKPFYAASCYKLFQVMYIYEGAAAGQFDLDRIITYQGCDYEGECGVIQNMPMGTAFTTRELCRMAIVYSDNIAANMLRRTYGYQPYRDYATSIACPVTGRYGQNQTTAREMGIVLMRVLQFAAADPLGEEVIGYLRDSIYKNRIPAGLPQGVEVGNKTGDYEGYMNDAAIVYLEDLTYVICFLSHGAPGDRVAAEASRLTYEEIICSRIESGRRTTGAARPSTQWYFAEGTTREGFETWLCLENPGSKEAHAAIKVLANGPEVPDIEVGIPAGSRKSLHVNVLLGTGFDVALCVASDQPLFSERSVYVENRGVWTEGYSLSGIKQPAREWYYPEGNTRDGSDVWLCLANPGTATAQAMVRALTDGGDCLNHPVTVPAMSRESLYINELIGPGLDFALFVTADVPILVERPVY